MTKYPAPEDAVDLLRLLNDHESDTVVSLQPLRYIESVYFIAMLSYVLKSILLRFKLFSMRLNSTKLHNMVYIILFVGFHFFVAFTDV